MSTFRMTYEEIEEAAGPMVDVMPGEWLLRILADLEGKGHVGPREPIRGEVLALAEHEGWKRAEDGVAASVEIGGEVYRIKIAKYR